MTDFNSPGDEQKASPFLGKTDEEIKGDEQKEAERQNNEGNPDPRNPDSYDKGEPTTINVGESPVMNTPDVQKDYEKNERQVDIDENGPVNVGGFPDFDKDKGVVTGPNPNAQERVDKTELNEVVETRDTLGQPDTSAYNHIPEQSKRVELAEADKDVRQLPYDSTVDYDEEGKLIGGTISGDGFSIEWGTGEEDLKIETVLKGIVAAIETVNVNPRYRNAANGSAISMLTFAADELGKASRLEAQGFRML